jgi:DNA-binding NtrC family response regulator
MIGINSNIVLVDDDALCISMYEAHLHNLGFTNLHSFYSGSRLLANLYKNFWVIFLDYYKALELPERIKIANPKYLQLLLAGNSIWR